MQEELIRINNFIMVCFSNTDDYKTNVGQVEKLRSFLREIKYSLKIDDIVVLLNNNPLFYSCIKVIFECNKEAITNGHMDRLFKNATIKNCLYTYCMINNIEIKEEQIEISDKKSYEALDLYFRDISGYKLLTAEEERTLARKYRAGDKEAKELFIISNLRYVIKIARCFIGRGFTLDDLIGYGNIGLLQAVEKFDPDLGFKFSTYATWWIRQSISRALSDYSRTIRLPVHLDEEVRRFSDTEEKLAKELYRFPTVEEIIYRYSYDRLKKKLNREPTTDEMDKELEISKEKYNYTRNANNQIVSMDYEVGEDGDISIGDLIPDYDVDVEDDAIRAGIRDYVQELLEASNNSLNARELEIIKCRFYFYENRKFTLEETGKRLGVTRERVRQIQARAIRKLRNAENRLRTRKKGEVDIDRVMSKRTIFTHNEEVFVNSIKPKFDTDAYERLLELIVIAKSYCNINIKELSVALLNQGFINNRHYANNEISNVLSMDYQTVILLKNKALEEYQGIINLLNGKSNGAYVKKLRP